MSELLVFLQNAWSPFYAGHTWPRASWLRALEKSRSGQRLRLLIDDFNVCHETTPIVTASPDECPPPDPEHIRAILFEYKSSVVVACGRQAERALLSLWPGALLAIPHPAHRVVTNELYLAARETLAGGLERRNPSFPPLRIALRQRRGSIELETL